MNLKKKLALAACCASLALPSIGMADGHFNAGADFRADLNFNSGDTDQTVFTNKDDIEDNHANVSTAHLRMWGKVNDRVSWKTRLNLETQGTNTDTLYGVANFVDRAYVKYRVNDMFGLKLGKMYTGTGGNDGMYTNHQQNWYQASDAVEGVSGNGGWAAPSEQTGLKLWVKHMNQKFSLGFWNGPSENGKLLSSTTTAGSSDYSAQSFPMFYGVRWHGSFMNGMIQPVLSYHMFDTPKEEGTDRTNTANLDKDYGRTFLAAGLKLNLLDNMLGIELDYLANTFEGTDGTTDKDTTNNSTVVRVRYNAGMVAPLVRYEMSEYESNETKTSETTKMLLALEVMPVANSDFRFHVGYQSSTTESKVDGTSYDFANGRSTTIDTGKEASESRLFLGAAFSI